MWVNKLKSVGAVALRIAVGVPILALFTALFYALVALVGVIVAYPIVALNVFCVLLGLTVSYGIGNVVVKEYRKRKEYSKFKKEFYD